MNAHAPLKKNSASSRTPQPWINTGIFRARLEKRKAEAAWRKSGLTVHHEIYQQKRNETTRLIESARSGHFSRKIFEWNGDQRKLFGLVHGLLGTKSSQGALPIHGDPSQLASDFSDFFDNKIQTINAKLRSNNASRANRFGNLAPFTGVNFSQFPPATDDEILKLIQESSSATCDLDPLPTKLLKNDTILPVITSAITDIVNESLRTGYVPGKMKQAILKPVLKKTNLDANEFKENKPGCK